jgi:formamidopyrimidine-DNA glycosylase
MPELPEVETAKRGIEPHITGQQVVQIIIRQPQLRWPIPPQIMQMLGQGISAVERRGKYLFLRTQTGTAILHLGMSGSLRICPVNSKAEKHDHVDFIFANKKILRLRDPRRFGAVLWTDQDPNLHRLIQSLGPEPLSDDFHGRLLFEKSRNKKVSIKQFIMNANIVVGVGNIYANESLFMAGISPKRAAGRISLKRYQCLAAEIKNILNYAIQQGGTTLRDFVREDGQSGYFQLELQVYGKAGNPCPKCDKPIKQITQGQRSTFYCPACQR